MGNFPLSSLHKRFNSSRGRTIKLFYGKYEFKGPKKKEREEILQVRDAECKFPLLEYFCHQLKKPFILTKRLLILFDICLCSHW